MAFKDLFKTKAERRAYAKGRRDQYNKEHPKLRYAIETTTYRFNENGTLANRPYGRVLPGGKFKTKKEAESALFRARKNESHTKRIVKEAVRKGKVNIYDSAYDQYDEYKLIKINERAK